MMLRALSAQRNDKAPELENPAAPVAPVVLLVPVGATELKLTLVLARRGLSCGS